MADTIGLAHIEACHVEIIGCAIGEVLFGGFNDGWYRFKTAGGRVAYAKERLDQTADVLVTRTTEEWLDVMRGFYGGFSDRLAVAEKSMKSPRDLAEETDIVCEMCGKNMVIKWGRNGYFLSCPDYPECKNAKPFTRDDEGNIVVEKTPTTDEKCAKCGYGNSSKLRSYTWQKK